MGAQEDTRDYMVTWHFGDQASYAIVVHVHDGGSMKTGEWSSPFPKERFMEGYEDFWPVGDMGPINDALRDLHGKPVRVGVKQVEGMRP